MKSIFSGELLRTLYQKLSFPHRWLGGNIHLHIPRKQKHVREANCTCSSPHQTLPHTDWKICRNLMGCKWGHRIWKEQWLDLWDLESDCLVSNPSPTIYTEWPWTSLCLLFLSARWGWQECLPWMQRSHDITDIGISRCVWHMVSAQELRKLSLMRFPEAWRHQWTLDEWDPDTHMHIITDADHTGRSLQIFIPFFPSPLESSMEGSLR